MARLEEMAYGRKLVDPEKGQMVDILQVSFIAPDGETYTHDFQNGGWTPNNPALQFMAQFGYQPTDFADGPVDCYDDQILIKIVWIEDEQTYMVHKEAMSGARKALFESEWFGSPNDEEWTHEPHRDSDDDDSDGDDIDVEVADDESDSGIMVNVDSDDND